MRQHLLHILPPAILLVLITVCTAFSLINPDIVTMTLPEAMIKQSVQSVLPLPIVPEGEHLQGKLVLDSISKLEMRDNGALIQGTVLGSGLTLKTKVGNQSLNMKIGEVRLPLTCDFTFRFDPAQKILYVTPHLEQPQPTKNPQADAVLPLLTLQGLEGKLFIPVALTIVFALGAALLLSLTVVPVLSSWLLKEGKHGDPWLVRLATRLYTPMLDFVLARGRLVMAVAAAGPLDKRRPLTAIVSKSLP